MLIHEILRVITRTVGLRTSKSQICVSQPYFWTATMMRAVSTIEQTCSCSLARGYRRTMLIATYVRQYDQNVINSNSCSCNPYSSVYSHEQESCTDGEEDDLGDYEPWPSSFWILIVRLRPQIFDGFWWISHVCGSACTVGKRNVVVKTDPERSDTFMQRRQ